MIIERVRGGHRRVGPAHLVVSEAQSAKRRRAQRQREHRRADVVPEAGQGQLFGAQPPADRVTRLHQQRPPTGLRHGHRGNQTVRAGADDDRIKAVSAAHQRYPPRSPALVEGPRSLFFTVVPSCAGGDQSEETSSAHA
jgi:hypothetical protein